MTVQSPERITYEGHQYPTASRPLDDYFNDARPAPNFAAVTRSRSSSCWRGYIGHWEIHDGLLRLLDLQAPYANPAQSLLYLVFPTTHSPIKADWFSGEIRLPKGEVLRYIHYGPAVYEEEVVLLVEHGVLVGSRIIDHRLDPA